MRGKIILDTALAPVAFTARHYLYVDNPEDLGKFYEFSLFVLEATTLSATLATG